MKQLAMRLAFLQMRSIHSFCVGKMFVEMRGVELEGGLVVTTRNRDE